MSKINAGMGIKKTGALPFMGLMDAVEREQEHARANPPVAGTLVYVNSKTAVCVYQTHYASEVAVTYKKRRTPAHH